METLRWSLYELPLDEQTRLPSAWNTSFRRAIDGLRSAGRIEINRRRLRTFEECVQHYPGKTLNVRARSLRQTFLPVLLEWSREAAGLSPKYKRGENELHHLKLIRKKRSEFESLAAAWRQLEQRLRPIYGNAREAPDNILALICKGRSLFGPYDVETDYSLADLVNWSCATGLVPDELAAELRDFCERFIPTERAETLQLTSIVHELANVPSRGQCSLREKTLEFLHERRKKVIEGMPGFQKPERKSRIAWLHNSMRYVYPPELRKLIDHTVFQKFDFVSPI